MAIRSTLESKITYRVKRSAVSVFVRQDFEDIGGYDQVGRILRQLVQKGLLINIGYGVYARAKQSALSGKVIPEKPLPELAQEALNKLGVKIIPTKAQKAYNEGNTTQVPTGRVIGVKGRISRRIGYNGKYVSFEQYA
ncbi:MAG: hypothetical protein KDI61_01090 [Alphaproteobacteria bacterium]|nr:hypothetical protein [Alphaproteobacteria bacterium]